MPLVSHLPLPSFQDLRDRGQQVLDLDQARCQDIRELHIGLLNMMPDAAFSVTERQYLELVGSCNQIAQFYVHPFTLDGLERGPEVREYIRRFYVPFDQLRRDGLDALIITGANVTQPDLKRESFWPALAEVVAWAETSVTSVMCSCLASHAIVEMLYGIVRRRLDRKRWGVFSHGFTRLGRSHPLLRGVNTRFDVPHSRWNTLDAEDLEEVGVPVLIQSDHDDVHLATSPDGFRFIFSQGHPEYDINSLLKEYKREVLSYSEGKRQSYPPFPENIFNLPCERRARQLERKVRKAREAGLVLTPPEFPEEQLERCLHNTWGDSGKAVFNNWLGLVYQLTHLDRTRPFLNGVDSEDPLSWRTGLSEAGS